jgi:hypothetical protein
VAIDGVDDSVVNPGLPDLSYADFEFEGTADSDNPDVPNMPYLGPDAAWNDGHGRPFSKTMFVAVTRNVM